MLSQTQGFRRRPNFVAGEFKFSADVSERDLVEVVAQWKSQFKDRNEQFLYLAIRIINDGKRAISFLFQQKQEKEDHRAFFYKISDQLKRKFGNDFCGWSLSSAPIIAEWASPLTLSELDDFYSQLVELNRIARNLTDKDAAKEVHTISDSLYTILGVHKNRPEEPATTHGL